MIKLKVKNSGIVKLQNFDDPPDGYLYIGTVKKEIPFAIKRIYYINKLANKIAIRGKHAHKKLQQIIFCINGKFTLNLDDGNTKQSIRMTNPGLGIILGPLLWHTMTKFTKDCVILVLADDDYKKEDYVRDYTEFTKLI